jgi:hypothetical protein
MGILTYQKWEVLNPKEELDQMELATLPGVKRKPKKDK